MPNRRLSSTQYSQESLDLLANFEKQADHLRRLAAKLPAVWRPEITDSDPREVHNRYVKCLLASYASRYSDYLAIVVSAVRARNYLGYAMAGRALIETAAVLRYYLKTCYEPTLLKPTLTGDDMRNLLTEDERHLRGGRFDWFAYLTQPLMDVVKAHAAELREKRSKKTSATEDALQQRNAVTCVERWGADTPLVLMLYACFCDMVHPNMGSHFMVASVSDQGVHFAKGLGEDTGVHIVDQTIRPLAAVTREFGKFYGTLLLSQWSAAEIAEDYGGVGQTPDH